MSPISQVRKHEDVSELPQSCFLGGFASSVPAVHVPNIKEVSTVLSEPTLSYNSLKIRYFAYLLLDFPIFSICTCLYRIVETVTQLRDLEISIPPPPYVLCLHL